MSQNWLTDTYKCFIVGYLQKKSKLYGCNAYIYIPDKLKEVRIFALYCRLPIFFLLVVGIKYIVLWLFYSAGLGLGLGLGFGGFSLLHRSRLGSLFPNGSIGNLSQSPNLSPPM